MNHNLAAAFHWLRSSRSIGAGSAPSSALVTVCRACGRPTRSWSGQSTPRRQTRVPGLPVRSIGHQVAGDVDVPDCFRASRTVGKSRR